MRIIHCADLHLDSSMTSNLDSDKAKLRKSELLLTFKEMISDAQNENVSAILIAGDLFDTKNISKTAKAVVIDAIRNNPEIGFYYLKGNHDGDNFLLDLDEIPSNLYLFEDSWRMYELGSGIKLYGLELSKENLVTAYSSLVLEVNDFNIVMLHGQETESDSKDKTEIININQLRNKNIDYLALGHIHKPKNERLDSRGLYCYPGCLEGRGFDECGPHGYVMLDINEDTKEVNAEFRPIAKRSLYEVPVDVSEASNSAEMLEKINSKLDSENYKPKDLVKIVLKGEIGLETEKNTDFILKAIEDRFFFVKLEDKTAFKINLEDYRLDQSLKGEFVRTVSADPMLTIEEKAEIIRCGFTALEGGELL